MNDNQLMPGSETPLLSASQENSIESNGTFSKDDIVAEVKKQLLLAVPLMFVNLLLTLIQTISVMFVGHVGKLALSGASMATSFASVTGFSLLIGLGGALDTFCGLAYGAKQYHMVGIHTQRAMLVLLLACIPLACLWANAGSILAFFGQDPEISAEAGIYAFYMIPTIFPYALLQCQFKFLQTQNIVVPMMLTSRITTLVHIPICWILVSKFGLGNKGAALANAISYWINDLFLALYVKYSPSCKSTWTGFSKEAVHDVSKFLKIAIPSSIRICFEIWSFEMMVLLAGLLPNPKLEASVLSIRAIVHYITDGPSLFPYLNTNTMVYMLPLGLGCAISTRVSNELGAGHLLAARLAVCIAIFMVAMESIVVAIIMILGRRLWAYCFRSEEKVVKYVADMMLLLAVTHLLDGIQSVVNGIARGCGWQKIGAIVNLGAYYLIGIPFGVTLALFYHIGGKGLWTGIIVAVFAQTIVLLIITIRTDWEKEAKKAELEYLTQ